jgi:hypothetical protein
MAGRGFAIYGDDPGRWPGNDEQRAIQGERCMKVRINGIAAVAGLLLALICVRAHATIGLKTRFAEVDVKKLKIGKTYSLQDLVNFPLWVTNTGSEALDLKVTPWAPQPNEMKPGFEPIPDPGWIGLSMSTFTVYPNMDAVTDVVISVPNDESLLGRRFLVYLWTQSRNPATLGVGLKSRLLLSVSSEKPTEEELKQTFKPKRLANLNFSFAPMEAAALDVPVGKPVALKDFKADLKLSNPNDSGYHFRFTPVAIWETEISQYGDFTPEIGRAHV